MYKIFHITGNTAYGGTTFYTKSLVQKALSENHKVYYETNQPEVIKEYQNLKVNIISIPELDRPLHPIKDLITLYKLYKLIKTEQFDIVHSHTSKGGFVGRIAARLAKTRAVVHTVQGFAFHEHSGKLTTWFYTILERFAGLFCQTMIFVNTHDRDLAIERSIVPKEKTVLIYNGVPPEKVQISPEKRKETRRSIRSEFNLPHDAVIVGSIARLSPQKGIQYLIEAIPALLDKYNSLWFLIVGTGDLEDEIRKRTKELNIDHRVIFAGYRNDNARLLNSLDIYILPSLWEGFSLSLLEAMAVKIPIITTDIKGNREAINDHCGILVPAKSSTAISKAINLFLENPSIAQEKAQNAYKKFMKEHTPENMYKDTFKLYEDLLNGK